MQRSLSTVALATLTLTLSGAAVARADQADVAVGAALSTYGYGVEAAVPIAPVVDLRANTGTLTYGMNGTQSGFTYGGSLKLANVAALVDVHPFLNSGFRVSTGIVSGSNRLDLTGTPSSAMTVTINGNTYTENEVGEVSGRATFGGANPYLGFGFGGARGRRGSIGFVADFGVIVEPAAAVGLTTSMDNLPPQGQAQLAADLARARSQIQNALGFVRTYPVIKIGFQTHL